MGDPPEKRWAHGGIAKVFLLQVYDSFTEKMLAPYGYKVVKLRIRTLYSQRLQADYDVEAMDREKVASHVDFAEWMVSLIRKGGHHEHDISG